MMASSFQVKEYIEETEGQALDARDASLPRLPHSWILGPLDLCWLKKKSVGYFTTGTITSYYHWVLGREVSSGAAVAAYLAQHDRTQEPGGWFTSGTEMRLEQGIYCCYDPFSKLDVRCELTIPGRVEFFAVDPTTGKKHPVTATLWHKIQVASFLRAELYPPVSSCLERHDRNLTPDQEIQLLSAVHSLYSTGVLPEAGMDLHFDPGYGTMIEHSDLVIATVFHSFARRQRWNAAATFFSELAGITPVAAVCLARCQMHLSQEAVLLPTLHAAWELNPDSPQLLVAMGEFHLLDQAYELAAGCAKKALSLVPDLRPAWLLLAHCFICNGQHELALAALNACPPPPLLSDPTSSADAVVPETDATTTPVLPVYDPDRQQQLQIMTEDKTTPARGLKYLPASIMLNREPAGQGLEPDVAPSRCNQAVLGAVFSLLQMIVDAVGWDEFLQVRSRVFAMYGEEVVQPADDTLDTDAALDQLAKGGIVDLSVVASTDSPTGMVPALYQTVFGAHNSIKKSAGKGKPNGLSSLDYDRSILLAHEPTLEDLGKRLCVRWLDDLILALWHDLQAYMDWSVRDRKVKQAKGQTHAGLVIGLPPAPGTEGVDVVGLPVLSPQDWVRRGMLAERLHHDEDAWQAYQAAAVLSSSNVSAQSAVLRLAVQHLDVGMAIKAMTALCKVHDSLALPEQKKAVPLAVSTGLAALVSDVGLEGAVAEIDAQKGHPLLKQLLQWA